MGPWSRGGREVAHIQRRLEIAATQTKPGLAGLYHAPQGAFVCVAAACSRHLAYHDGFLS
jgi:hypothetical protein